MIISSKTKVQQAKESYASMMGTNGFVSDQKRKEFNTWQKRSKGYKFTSTSQPSDIGKIELSGTAKMFLGFKFANVGVTDTFTFSINEEIIVEDGQAIMFQSSSNYNTFFDEYFEYMRFLTGKDTIKMTYKGTGQDVNLEFYYI